jgi:subtilisin family serine protease
MFWQQFGLPGLPASGRNDSIREVRENGGLSFSLFELYTSTDRSSAASSEYELLLARSIEKSSSTELTNFQPTPVNYLTIGQEANSNIFSIAIIRAPQANQAQDRDPTDSSEEPANRLREAIPELETQALITFLNSRATSGETLPWGVRATWQGRDLTNLGNIGINTYAFVIDSGVLATTRDLNLNQEWSRSWITGESPFADGAGHGTHVAGIIGALANGIGVVGVAPGASIVSLKVFGDTGTGTPENVISAIDYATQLITTYNLDLTKVVINLSLGGPFSSALSTAVLNAANLGIRFAIAAGNNGGDVDATTPANTGTHPNIFTVSAVDNTYTMPSWSSWDQVTTSDPVDSVDLAAPGVNILSYSKFGLLANLSGTSMAAPHVAGALLVGGVQAGDLVKPFTPGTADPFAWAAGMSGGNSGIPETLNGQILWGSVASETVSGGGGNDRLTGALASGTSGASLGEGQIDLLIGGLGADTFVLGDSRGVFYDDRNTTNLGKSDYAIIQDFTKGVDKIQLLTGNYFTTMIGGNTSIYWDANANGRFETQLNSNDELIAIINNSTISSSDIIWA